VGHTTLLKTLQKYALNDIIKNNMTNKTLHPRDKEIILILQQPALIWIQSQELSKDKQSL
jgi:hypothetical protein